MSAERDRLTEATLRVLDELPRERVLRDQVVPSVPPTQLDGLVALVAWGGDALSDTGRLCDGSG